MEDTHKYKEGDIVYQKEKPTVKLEVRRFVHRIYYCRVPGEQEQKDLVFFENELMS